MNAKAAKWFRAPALLVICLLAAPILCAQAAGATLSGTISGPAGAVPYATVTVKNVATGKSAKTQGDQGGHYRVANLVPGKYEISISAVGFGSQTKTVTLAAGTAQTFDFKLKPELSLGSLGFSTAQTKGSAREQALLNKRSHMLQIHQKLGLITVIPMVATLVAATQAGGRHGSPTGRNVHMALGAATAGLYFATAYYAIFAPKVAGVKTRGPIRFHEAMAWIHGPGMILTPILGIMAEQQRNQGERVHGIAKYHGLVAVVTAAAYGLALLSVTKPGWLPGLGHHVAALFPFHHHHILSASRHPFVPAAGAAMVPGRN
jgi:hypothetical protein